MPVSLEVTYSLAFDDSPRWPISPALVQTIDGSPYVKLRAHDMGFIRVVCFEVVELPPKQRCSFSQVPGWQKLIQCRNECALKSRGQTSSCAEVPIMKALFGNSVQSKPQKAAAPRHSAQKLAELRGRPVCFEFVLPGQGDWPACSVQAVKPIHPCDDLVVFLDESNIANVANFIRSHGIAVGDLLARRSYGTEPGAFRNGAKCGLIKKRAVDECDETPEELAAGKKYLTVLSRKELEDREGAADFVAEGATTEALPGEPEECPFLEMPIQHSA